MSEIVSFSEVFKWDTCQKQYHYSFIQKLRPFETADAMLTGTKGHRLLQDFYSLLKEGKTKEVAQKEIQASASKILLEDGRFDGTLLKSWTLVDNFIRDTEFKAEVAEVENRFLIPLSMITPTLTDIQIGFTPDVVFKRTGDFYDVEDAKFVGRAWSKSKKEMFHQAKLYQIFLRRMGYNVSRSSVRFFNVKTGDISVDTAKLETGEEKELITDFVDAVTEVVNYRRTQPSRGRRTQNYTTCQYCPFQYPCYLERQGKDATKTLEANYMKSDYDYNV